MLRIAFLLFATGAAFGADLIVVNANVITVDKSKPHAEAFAIDNGRFTAVGTNAEIRRLATPATRVIDLKGMTVTPGFNDAHLHPTAVFAEDSPYYVPWLGPEKVKTMDDLVAALKAKAARTPKGQLVSGSRYDDTKLGRHPNRHDLDKVSTEHPVSISHASGHIIVVNTYVLQASGITKDTKDLPGGSFDRDPDGMPNGVIREGARRLLTRFGGESQPRIPWKDRVDAYLRCFREYAERGLTSVGVAGGSPESLRLYEAVRDAGNPVRVGFMFSEAHFAAAKALGLRSGFGDDYLRLTSIKSFQGNSLSGRTCWLSEPYSDQPGYYGIPPARSQQDLDAIFQQMHDAGWQIATHSNGDREIDMVLTAIERAQAKNPRPDARHRIEHASVMNQSLLERAKKAGVILVFHSYMWEHGDKLESFGEKRLAMMHPYRTALDMSIHVAGHSDSTVSAAYPLLRIQDMVTRQGSNGKQYGANQRVTVDEAIEVWTLGGAYATFEEKIKGTITPGKLADFVVLQTDPHKVAPDKIKDIVVEATYTGGQMVYSTPATGAAVRPIPRGSAGN
ncbi:MAG: amidohydrolase [Bryobacteraceae bacterium]|jgi:predicted amidohydrolase YtcJ